MPRFSTPTYLLRTVKSAVTRIVDKLCSCFSDDLPFFVLLFIINTYICFSVIFLEDTIHFAISMLMFNYAVTCLLVLSCQLNKYVGRYILKPLFLIVGNALLSINTYYICTYRSRLAMPIIVGTNLNEVKEFVMMYFSWATIITASVLLVFVSIILYVAICKIKVRPSRCVLIVMSALSVISFMSLIFNKDGRPKLYEIGGVANIAEFRYNPTYPKIATDIPLPAHIVTIIGESFSLTHSSLYGYDKLTNPLLQEKLDDGDLIIFNKITTPATSTSACFMYLLNTYKVGMEEGYYFDCTNLIEVLDRADYHTAWISTQDESGIFNNISSGHHKICDESMFVTVNPDGTKYDGALLDWHITDSNKYQAVFYHLMGQHYMFCNRYPGEYELFGLCDYPQYTMKNRAGEMVAQYDNATLYNDYVVSSLIDKYRDTDAVVFYFPDHGLDIYDTEPNYCGHAKNTPESQSICKKIPFMVYLSPLYQQLRPELTERIKNAVNKEFCTDKFIYAAMDAAGLKFADNDDVVKYSLFSEPE